MAKHLCWLPERTDWRRRLREAAATETGDWQKMVELAKCRIDFVQTNALDDVVRRRFLDSATGKRAAVIRLAILGTSTTTHLHAGIRVAGLRRNIIVETYECAYGQYLQELLDTSSQLHAFRPDVVLFLLDSHHMALVTTPSMTERDVSTARRDASGMLRNCWRLARDGFGCQVLQQTFIDVFPSLLGSNEHRMPGSPSGFIHNMNYHLREIADEDRVDLVALDVAVSQDGVRAWHDPGLWHRAKQEISPLAAPMFGELVLRPIAAARGLSRKCLILDLDNTLWGGVIGDDGLDGIVVGQGSPLGEAFSEVQSFAKALAQRGIILAVSSKNDDAIAREPFEQHPEMVLRIQDISAFRANWQDKPGNVQAIAEELNIGLDSLVFLDDNPFERELVRDALPMVAVPEVPDDPAEVPYVLAQAGYFESLALTEEDRARTSQYRENIARRAMSGASSDLATYLRGLEMRMLWKRFDPVGLPRIVQLINKTNQFNLTTRRYTETDIKAIMADETAFGLQIRLQDRFGDNGVIAIVIGRSTSAVEVTIDTWLMSCRVLGRQVEDATLSVLIDATVKHGGKRLVGEYFPTARNDMVRDHYERLGFTVVERRDDGYNRALLELSGFVPKATSIEIYEG